MGIGFSLSGFSAITRGEFVSHCTFDDTKDFFAYDGQPTEFKEVHFDYEDRVDHFRKYGPALVDMDKRLKWISVYVGGNLLKNYRLDYAVKVHRLIREGL